MNQNYLLCAAAALLLGGCGEDGLSPNPVPVQFRVVSSAAAPAATSSGAARGELGEVVVTGTFAGACSTGLDAVARQYGSDRLVLDLISTPGARACEAGAPNYAFEYESVLKDLKPGRYQIEVQHNAGSFNVPTQVVTVR